MTFAPWEALVSGHFVEAILISFTRLIGDWIYVWFFGLSLLMLYDKTRDYGTVGVIGLSIVSLVLPLMPPIVHLIAYIILGLAIGIILYRVFH